MKIRKAVIPAAGLGTRMIPASKAMPKEMLPIVDKPAIQYIVEEAVQSGITDILIILSRGKTIVEDHFDRAPELEQRLLQGGKEKLHEQVVHLAQMANIQYLRQGETKGLGHAVLCAKAFVGDEPFAVLYGDDVVIGEDPAIGQLCKVYEEFGLGTVGIKTVSDEDVARYCSLNVEGVRDNIYKVFDMIEKPKPEQVMSNFAILGRCVLPSNIFGILENTPLGAGNELQLTDGMRALANRDTMMGIEYTGKRYDMGNKMGVMEAIVEVGLKHPEIGADFKAYLKEIAKNI